MKRIISVIAVAALLAMMLMVMAVPALAKGQPNTKINNPYACVNDTFIFTYQAPPADGGIHPSRMLRVKLPVSVIAALTNIFASRALIVVN